MHVVPHRLIGPIKAHEYELQRRERKGHPAPRPRWERGGVRWVCGSMSGCVNTCSPVEGLAIPKLSSTRQVPEYQSERLFKRVGREA